LSYGSDFLGIEIFFRGFLILAFIKWAGQDAILPMACFYCTIHFGKPLGECISSYFGGILLGIVVYNTRSIYGGLIVHLGIAWLMEIGGYIGNALR
jgi:membrane protease YdiL (CAAX protease family)